VWTFWSYADRTEKQSSIQREHLFEALGFGSVVSPLPDIGPDSEDFVETLDQGQGARPAC
jgi:hypothetical protein